MEPTEADGQTEPEDSVPQEEESQPGALIPLTLVMIAAIQLRFLSLGWESPWLDEINNWAAAEQLGFQLRASAHSWTYWSISAGTSLLGDNEFGLRLYSAIFGVITVFAAGVWAAGRFGPMGALAAGGIAAISPMAIHYSQDANHYAPLILAGLLAWMAVPEFLASPKRPRWILLVLTAAVCAAAINFHPLAILPLGALATATFLFLLLEPGRWGPENWSPAMKQKLAALLGAIVFLAAFNPLLNLAFRVWAANPIEGRQFGLGWDFWSTMLASFYGAIFQYRIIDLVLGISGAALAAYGWISYGRSRDGRWPAISAAILVGCCVLPFAFITPRQYFAPRYLSPITLVMLFGVILPLFLHYFPMKIVALLWLSVYTANSAIWYGQDTQGSFQPSKEAIEWINNNAPRDTVVLTGHPYSGSAAQFLWDRMPTGARTLIPLNMDFPSGLPAVRQAREQAFSNNHTYFLSYLEDQELKFKAWKSYIEANSDLVERIPSNITDAFTPIDWSVPIRRLERPKENPFLLAFDEATSRTLRHGADASYVSFSPRPVVRLPGNEPNSAELRSGGVAVYRIQILEPQTLEITLEAEESAIASLSWMDEEFLIPVNGKTVVYLAVVETNGPGRMEISLPFNGGDGPLLIHHIATADGEHNVLTPMRKLGFISLPDILDREKIQGFEDREVIKTKSFPVEKENLDDYLLVAQRVDNKGTGDTFVNGYVRSGQNRWPLFQRMSWQYAPIKRRTLLKKEELDTRLTVENQVFTRSVGQHPRQYQILLGEIEIYTASLAP